MKKTDEVKEWEDEMIRKQTPRRCKGNIYQNQRWANIRSYLKIALKL